MSTELPKVIVYAGTHYGCVHRVVARLGERELIVSPIAAPQKSFSVHVVDTEPRN